MSFAPSFSSFPSFDSISDSGPSQIHKSETEERKKKKTKGRSPKDKRLKREGRSAQSKDTFDASSRAKAEEPTEFYFSDRAGDSGNIQYGKLSSSSIPKYFVVGRTHCTYL